MPITEHRTYTLRCEVCDNGLAIGLGLVDDISDVDATIYDTVEELLADAEQRHWYVEARIALCPRHVQTVRPVDVEARPCTAITETVGTYERQWHDVEELSPAVGDIVMTRTRSCRWARALVRDDGDGWFDPQLGSNVYAEVTHWRHQTEFERRGKSSRWLLPRMIFDGKDITDLLHPNRRCTCHGEGECEWCRAERLRVEVATARRTLCAAKSALDEIGTLRDSRDEARTIVRRLEAKYSQGFAPNEWPDRGYPCSCCGTPLFPSQEIHGLCEDCSG